MVGITGSSGAAAPPQCGGWRRTRPGEPHRAACASRQPTSLNSMSQCPLQSVKRRCRYMGGFCSNNPRHRQLHCRANQAEADVGDGGAAGRSGGGWAGKTDESDGDDDDGPLTVAQLLWRAVVGLVGALLLLFAALTLDFVRVMYFLDHVRKDPYPEADRSNSGPSLSIIIPVLNEARCIQDTLRYLKRHLQPAALEIILVDGGSTDGTARLARREGGVRVLKSDVRRRSVQMNRGAEAASGQLLCFLHADTRPPADLVAVARHTLADPRTTLFAFLTTLEVPEKRLWFMTWHQFVKTSYLPMMFRPLDFARGLRCLFGDQVQCCRRADFQRAGGFNNKLPLMEDADLCIRMHTRAEPLGPGSRGRVRMVNTRRVQTSGRRLVKWGNVRGTLIHFVLGTAWYFGTSSEQMVDLYHRLYTDFR